jgi:hypothetical protein
MNTIDDTKDFCTAIAAHIHNIVEIDAKGNGTSLGSAADRYRSNPHRLRFGSGGNRFYCVEAHGTHPSRFDLVNGWPTLEATINGASWHSFQILVIVPPELVSGSPAVVSALEKQRNFAALYESCLREAVIERPDLYAWPVSDVPRVASRMVDAVARGTFNHDSLAFHKLAKKLGIKPTRKAILEAYNA